MDNAEKYKYRFILASQSPRRKELLGHLSIQFETISLDVDESSNESLPESVVMDVVAKKVEGAINHIANDIKQNGAQMSVVGQNRLPCLLCTDTLVAIDNQILGKPKDKQQSEKMLKTLSGKTHQVYTSVGLAWCLNIDKIDDPNSWEMKYFFDKALVKFSEIDAVTLSRYIETGEGLDKAGSYGIQGPALAFIESLEGSYSTVMGLPLSKVLEALKALPFSVHKGENWRELFD